MIWFDTVISKVGTSEGRHISRSALWSNITFVTKTIHHCVKYMKGTLLSSMYSPAKLTYYSQHIFFQFGTHTGAYLPTCQMNTCHHFIYWVFMHHPSTEVLACRPAFLFPCILFPFPAHPSADCWLANLPTCQMNTDPPVDLLNMSASSLCNSADLMTCLLVPLHIFPISYSSMW